MAELAYAYGLGPYGETLGGSTPLSPIIVFFLDFVIWILDFTASGGARE